MTIHLTPEQEALWQQDAWSSYRVEEDILEDLIWRNIDEVTVVTNAAGTTVLFAVSQGGRL